MEIIQDQKLFYCIYVQIFGIHIIQNNHHREHNHRDRHDLKQKVK